MNDLVQALQATPLPTILVIAGIFFLFLSIAGGLAGKINIPPNRQKQASIFGGILLVCGLAIHLTPINTNRAITGAAPDENTARVQPAKPDESLAETSFKDWPVIGEDAFISSASDWWTGEYADEFLNGTARIVSGYYRWESEFNNRSSRWQLSPYDPSTDFYVAVDIKILPQQENQRISAGLIFRKTYNTGYRVYLISNSFIQVVYVDNGNYKVLLDWTYIPRLNTRNANRLAVLANGPSIKVYINEKLYASIKDSSQLNGGVGVFLAGEEEPSVRGLVDFDNFIYRRKP